MMHQFLPMGPFPNPRHFLNSFRAQHHQKKAAELGLGPTSSSIPESPFSYLSLLITVLGAVLGVSSVCIKLEKMQMSL